MSDEINKDTVDYRDSTPFDDTKLNSITEISKGIRHKLYGKDVREAIAQGIERTYEDASKNGNANMEVEMARGTEPTLNDRLYKMDYKDAEVTAQLAQTEQELSSQLAETEANKVDKNGGGQVNYAMLSQDVREAMTGGSVAVVGINSVLDENIVDGEISVDKLSSEFKSATSNLIKLTRVTVEGTGITANVDKNFVSTSGTATMTSKMSFYLSSQYLQAGTYYLFITEGTMASAKYQVNIYDSNNTSIAVLYPDPTQKAWSFTLSTATNLSRIIFTIPSGLTTNFNGNIWIARTLATPYEPPYASKIVLDEDLDLVKAELNGNVDVDNLTKEMAHYLYDGGLYNLFNIKTITDNKRMDCLGNLFDDTLRFITAPIDISKVADGSRIWFKQSADGVTINNANAAWVTIFDSEDTVVAKTASEFYDIGYIQKAANYDHMVVTLPYTYTNIIISVGFPTKYKPYYTEKVETEQPFKGKKFLSYGDSQTAMNRWQPLVCNYLEMENDYYGFGGYPLTWARSLDGLESFGLATDYNVGNLLTKIKTDNPDIIAIMGGTNDMNYDGKGETFVNWHPVLLGENTDTVNTTYKGALKKIVVDILTSYPDKTVIIMSPIGGMTKSTGMNLTIPITNALGYTLADFAKAAEEIANYLGVPFIPVYDCGITIYNSATYIADGIHINDTIGAKKVANAVINGLNAIAKNV